MLKQEPHIMQRDTDELPMVVVTGATIIPDTGNPEEVQTEHLKPEVAKFLKNFSFYLVISDTTQIPKTDLRDPIEIYYIEETNDFWIRCCAKCISRQNKPKAADLLAHHGITLENLTFSDTECLGCVCEIPEEENEAEEIQTETAQLATDVQK